MTDDTPDWLAARRAQSPETTGIEWDAIRTAQELFDRNQEGLVTGGAFNADVTPAIDLVRLVRAMPTKMGEEGQLTGAKDRHGLEIRIGDTLRFDYDEWNRTASAGEQEDCIFTMKYEDGQLVHPGSYSDLARWCEVIKAEETPNDPQ
jgi:hypothetical protein